MGTVHSLLREQKSNNRNRTSGPNEQKKRYSQTRAFDSVHNFNDAAPENSFICAASIPPSQYCLARPRALGKYRSNIYQRLVIRRTEKCWSAQCVSVRNEMRANVNRRLADSGSSVCVDPFTLFGLPEHNSRFDGMLAAMNSIRLNAVRSACKLEHIHRLLD